MKKIIASLVLISAVLLPVAVLAINDPTSNPTGVSVGSLNEIINSLIRAAWIIFGGIAVICFVIAGVLFLVAGGNPEKVQQARAAFLWGVAGVVVGIIAFSILKIVGSIMTGGF